jgi:hypothetical protein
VAKVSKNKASTALKGPAVERMCDFSSPDSSEETDAAGYAGTARKESVFDFSSPAAAAGAAGAVAGIPGVDALGVVPASVSGGGAQQARNATLQSLAPRLASDVRPATENEQVMNLVRAVYFHPDRRTTVQLVANNVRPTAEQQQFVASAQDAVYLMDGYDQLARSLNVTIVPLDAQSERAAANESVIAVTRDDVFSEQATPEGARRHWACATQVRESMGEPPRITRIAAALDGGASCAAHRGRTSGHRRSHPEAPLWSSSPGPRQWLIDGP